jgi:hypothetical protein
MRGRHPLLALCALLAAPLAAQQPEPQAENSGQTITVTGEREDSDAERRREAARFVDSHAVRTRIGQLARWHEPICVRAGGLPLEMNARIAIRVMAIAERLGIPTNRAELCRPNVRIAFTGEPQRMVRLAERRNTQVIGFHYASERDRIMQVRQPVQAWYVTATRMGGSAGTIDQAGITPGGALGGRPGSRLGDYVSSGLAHVLILADTRHVVGEEADAIAELVAFLALAQTPVAETCDDTETILNLMNPACPPSRRPVALTPQDIAYLQALYRMNAEAAPGMQRGSIVQNMTQALGGR